MKISLKSEDEYEDLLGMWSDLESALGITLSHPHHVEEFAQRIGQYDLWMLDLLRHDTDVGLYLLFQLAGNTTIGYSASHALVCAVLCHLVATDFALSKHERDTLVHAAMTMNLAMTALQDELATQKAPPRKDQLQAIHEHPEKTAAMLQSLGMSQALLLDTIRLHHRPDEQVQALEQL
jgi:response regulator RpfG family c-di-GMP phosphodiesterase